MTHRVAAIAGIAAFCLTAAAPAHAQVIRTRPFPGLFGSGDPAKSVTQVDFLSFVAGGFETTTFSLADGKLGSTDDRYSFGNLVFRGRLAHQARRTVFGADAAATTSYYAGAGSLSPLSLSAGAHFDGSLGRRGTFALRQSMSYSPYFVVASVTADDTPDLPTAPESADPSVDPRIDLRTARLSTKSYQSFASTGRQVGRTGSLFASYGLNYVDFAPGVYDLLSQTPRGGYRQRFGRFTSFVASYGLQLYEYRNSPYDRLMGHNAMVGIGYDRPLSAWRRTTVGFNVSTGAVRQQGALSVHLNASAHMLRRFGRSWFTGVNYLRGQQVLEGFTQPFFTFSDTVAGTVSGRLPHALLLSGRASYSHSRFSIDALDNVFDTVSASTRLQIPVMWALAAYVEGYFAQHDFQRRLGLLEGIPSSLERFGTRAGLTVTVPVLR